MAYLIMVAVMGVAVGISDMVYPAGAPEWYWQVLTALVIPALVEVFNWIVDR